MFRPAAQSPSALAEFAQERSDFLSSIDPNFGVQLGLRDGAQTYEIYAKTKEAQLGVEMTVVGDPVNKVSLLDAITYGIPASVDVDAFSLTGSPLMTELGADKLSKGKIEMRSNKTRPAKVVLHPGQAYSLIADRYSFAATLYIGQTGFSIRADDPAELFSFDLRGQLPARARGRADITMGLRRGVLGAMQIQRLDALAVWGHGRSKRLIKEACTPK